MKGLTDIAGILVGHASDYDGLTGCTAILCEAGAAAGGDIRGSATGTEEWDLLHPHHVTERIHAVVLAGGSAFGLEAASGVRRYLEHKGVGFETGAARVPLVPCAILYDLNVGKSSARPTREMGEAAASEIVNVWAPLIDPLTSDQRTSDCPVGPTRSMSYALSGAEPPAKIAKFEIVTVTSLILPANPLTEMLLG